MNQPQHYKLSVFKQGNGQPVVLLHGQISTHNYMGPVAKLLAKQRSVYNFDLLGFGDSPRPKDCAYTPDDHIAAIKATIEAENIPQPFILVGHSMGALLAIHFAKSHPKLVKDLVVTGLPLFPSNKAGYKSMVREFPGARLIMKGPSAYIIRKWQERHEGFAAALVTGIASKRYSHFPKEILGDIVRHNWQSYSRSMKHVVFGSKPLVELKILDMPITIISGLHDTISLDADQQIAALKKPNITCIGVEAGHHIPVEYPKVVADAVLSV